MLVLLVCGLSAADAAATAAPSDSEAMCNPLDGSPMAAAKCYAGSFLVTVLTKINNNDARTAEHQREALLFYLGGDATLQSLRTDSQEDSSCTACTSNPMFSDILYDARAALTPEQLAAYDGLQLNYPMLTHYIYTALPKSADGVWLKPDPAYAGDAVAQATRILEVAFEQLGSVPTAVPLGDVVTEPALCDGSIDMGGADRSAILCYAGSFLSSLIGKLNAGMARSSEHVRKAMLLYLTNSDAAFAAATTGEAMDDKSCTLCFTAPNLATGLAGAAAARTDLQRRQYAAAAASTGLWPAVLSELIFARLSKSADGVSLSADARFGGDAPSQATALLRAVFADADSAAVASPTPATAVATPATCTPAAKAVHGNNVGGLISLTVVLFLCLLGLAVWAQRKLGTAGLKTVLREIMHDSAPTGIAKLASDMLSPRFAKLASDKEEEQRIKATASSNSLEAMGTTPSTQTVLETDMQPARLLPSSEPRSDGISAPNGPILSRHVVLGLRTVLVLLAALVLVCSGGLLFGPPSAPAAKLMSATTTNGRYLDVLLLGGSILAPKAPSSHVFTHGQDIAAPREYQIEMLQLPTNVGELHVEQEQTHEIYFEPVTRTAFVSVVTSSRLLELPLQPNGVVAPMVRSWVVGHPDHNEHPELAALHNVAGSHRHPGMLWVSTEGDDRIYLVDPTNGWAVKYAMHVPNHHIDASGTVHNVGGPHSVREAPDGTVWVCLKGASFEGPQYDDPEHAAYYAQMLEMRFAANNEPIPDGYAVWHVDPEHYNSTAFPAKGGVLFDALQSPTMTAVDGVGNTWHTQDKAGSILHVTTDGVATQVSLPSLSAPDMPEWTFASGNGPGIVTDPAGNVWLCNLVPGQPWMVRFAKGSPDPLIFKDLGTGQGDGSRHIIHMAFSSKGGASGTANVLYALTSALLAPGATESVIMLEMDENWESAKFDGEVGRQEIVLPTRNSAAHRIAVVDSVSPHSLLVTGLLTNNVFQIMGPGI